MPDSLEVAGESVLQDVHCARTAVQVKSYIRTGDRQYTLNPTIAKRMNMSDNPTTDTTPPEPNSQQARLKCYPNEYALRFVELRFQQ